MPPPAGFVPITPAQPTVGPPPGFKPIGPNMILPGGQRPDENALVLGSPSTPEVEARFRQLEQELRDIEARRVQPGEDSEAFLQQRDADWQRVWGQITDVRREAFQATGKPAPTLGGIASQWAGNFIVDPARSFAQGATGDWWDELMGLLAGTSNVVGNALHGDWNVADNFNEARAAAETGERQAQAAFEERAPELATGLKVAGAVVPGSVGFGLGVKLGSKLIGGVPGRVAGAVGAGATIGGAAGAGAADEGDRGQAALEGAGWGGATGLAVPAAGRVLGGLFGLGAKAVGKLAGTGSATTPTATAARQAAQAASRAGYAATTAEGVAIAPTAINALGNRLEGVLLREGYDQFQQAPAALRAAVNDVLNASKAPSRSLDQADLLRRTLRDAGTTPNERRIAGEMVAELDDWLRGLTAADIVAGDVQAGLTALNSARQSWAQQSRLGIIERAINNSETSPVVGAAGQARAIQREFGKIARNESQMRQFSAQEQAAIRQIAGGGPSWVQGLRSLSRWIPGPWITGPYGGITGDFMLPFVGQAVKSTVDRTGLTGVQARVNALTEALSGGGPAPASVSYRDQLLSRLLSGLAGPVAENPPQFYRDAVASLLGARPSPSFATLGAR